MDELVTPFTPATEVRLLTGVPLDVNYTNTRDFSDVTAQQTYFFQFLFYTFNDFTYQRETQAIRVPLNYEVARKCNYCMYLNSNYNNKWFYAFVTRVEYESPTVTRLYIVQDVMQTWLFDYTIVDAFIERETTASDDLFRHTIPENLETGPFKVANSAFWNLGGSAIVVAYADTLNNTVGGTLTDNVFSGVKYLWYGITESQITALNQLLDSFSAAGHLDDILGIFQVPYSIITDMALSTTIQSSFNTIDGYAPRNKKLFSWPYRFLAINNCRGTEVQYRYELFATPSQCTFQLHSVFNMKSMAIMNPQNYQGVGDNYDEGCAISDFPFCSWVGNIYANYVARNSNQLQMGLIQAALSIGTAVLGVAPVNTARDLVKNALTPDAGASYVNALSSMASVRDMEMYPYSIQGQVTADVANIAWERVGYFFKQYSITQEYAKAIDAYFDVYGYKVNRRGKPLLKSRVRWNYIKCNTITMTGPIPQEHMSLIKNLFIAGITFWHDDDVGDYSSPNPIAAVGRTASEESTEDIFQLSNLGYEGDIPENQEVIT